MSLASIHRRIEVLTAEMVKAAEAEDFETAAKLRNEIARLKGEAAGSPLVRQPPPGEMGLGTHIPVAERPPNWRPPRKPGPMTSKVRPRRK
jgi:hypothetical protein